MNAVHLAEVLQVLARHGFADVLRRAGFQDGLPARVLRGLRLMEAPSGEPATFGRRLCAALMDLGPTFVKFGQILSTRPDVVGTEVAQDLNRLQDKVAPLPFETMATVIRDALGGDPDKLFATFDKTSVASASLSQVYHATLPSGEEVAVKVQRPGVEKVIDSDLSLMRQIAEWVAAHVEEIDWLDPVGIVDEFSRSIKRELDFTIEARVIEQFRANFEDIDFIFVPEVFQDHSERRILTMAWVDGVRIDRLGAYEERGCDPHTVAVNCSEVLCKMVFEHRLFHADPHPGNVFVLRDNRIAFLDMGMAGHLERGDVAILADLVLAIVSGDSSECVRAVLALTPRRDPDDREALEHEIADFIAFEAQAIIGGGQVTKGLERAVQILRRYHLNLAPRFSLLLKALGTVEVVGRSLDPDLDFVPIIQPYMEELALSRYQPQQLIKEARRNALSLLHITGEAPEDIAVALKKLRGGKLRFHMHHEHLDNLAAALDRSSNRQAVAMITASLIIGSSFLIRSEPSVSRLGLAGFVCAGMLGLVLIVSILWKRKF